MQKLKNKIKKLLLKEKFGVLATKGPNYPYTLLLAYYAKDDLTEIYFATYQNTSKYKNIEEDNNVTFLVFKLGKDPIEEGKSITVLGQAEETKDQNVIDKFLIIHPDFEDFVNKPNCSFFKIKVKKFVLVNNIKEVEIFENK